MKRKMAGPTKPGNKKGLRIIMVVHLALKRTALFTRQFFDFPAFQVHVGIGSTVRFYALRLRHRIQNSENSHCLSVARKTVALFQSTARIPTPTQKAFHDCYSRTFLCKCKITQRFS
jgi:hypothetical protein